jgi:tetratricopeptide (TPR) repeat protein
MTILANQLILSLVACATALGAGCFTPCHAQPLRKPLPGYKVLGDTKTDATPASISAPTGSNAGAPSGVPKGQVRTYGSRGGRAPKAVVPAVLTGKKKSPTRLAAEAVKYYSEGLAEEKKGNLNGAILKLNQSFLLKEYLWHERDKTIPVLLEKIASIYVKQKKIPEAADTLEKSLTYYTKIYGPGTPERIPSLMMMGRILQDNKESEKSFDYFKQAYTLIERSKGKESSEAMRLRLTLARLAKNCNWEQTAAEYYQSCLDLDEKNLSPDEHRKVLEEYSAVLIKLGKEDEARAVLARTYQGT